jgi:phage tail sheath protein FI
MAVYLTPGVYRRPQPVQSRDIRLVRTDVAGFVGFAERGPLPTAAVTQEDAAKAAIRLTSWKEFLATFGGFTQYGYLAYAVRAFFDNGGTTCYVVRVAGVKPGKSFQGPRRASFALPGTRLISAESVDAPTLVATANAGDSELIITDTMLRGTDQIAPGDLIELSNGGITEFSMVVERDNGAIRIGRKLTSDYPKGTPLSKYVPGLVAMATSEGSWANRIKLTVTPLTAGDTVQEFALRVTLTPGLDPSQPVEEEFYNHLSFARGPFYAPDLVNSFSNLITLSIADSKSAVSHLLVGTGPLVSGVAWPEGGQDGLKGVTTADFTGGPDDLRGLRLLEEIDEVGILCVPDAVFEPLAAPSPPPQPPPDPCFPPIHVAELQPTTGDDTAIPPAPDTINIYRAMINQCERLRDRVGIYDFPGDTKKPNELKKWKEKFVTRFGAIYYPWLKVPDSLALGGPSRRVPPSGHVAGVYASVDNQFGVHRPPANKALEFVTSVTDEITSLDQENLNPFGINAIRLFQGRGIRVWGARSLAGSNDADWQFIHVRRLMSMIEKSVDKSTQWAVFESNDFALRRTLVHSLLVFLEAIWRKGGLKGALPAQGFYVKCDDTNNPAEVVDSGRLVCEVGIAAADPMEFLVFEIHQQPGGAEFVES